MRNNEYKIKLCLYMNNPKENLERAVVYMIAHLPILVIPRIVTIELVECSIYGHGDFSGLYILVSSESG